MYEPRNKRRSAVRRTLLEPRTQLRYGLYCFLFTLGVALVTQIVTYWSLRSQVIRVVEEAGGEVALLRGILDTSLRATAFQNLWLVPAVALLALLGTARLLHRFVGPQISIRRFLGRLRDGEYGAHCEIRKDDELHELVADLNDVSDALARRHGHTAAAPRDREGSLAEAGFSIVEVLAVLTVISVLSMMAASQFLRAYDRARQRSTLADMRTVAAAQGTYHVDEGEYAPDLDSLEPYYLEPVPPVDRWGYAWTHASDGTSYEMSSTGSDGLAGPAPPSPWDGDPYECDLVLRDGTFSQAPDS